MSTGIGQDEKSVALPVRNEMDALKKNLNRLCGRIFDLETRLEPVLRPSKKPTDEAKKDENSSVCSPLTAELKNVNEKWLISSIQARVEDILDRLEI